MMLLPCLILGKFMPIRAMFTHFLNEENMTALVGLDSSHKCNEYTELSSQQDLPHLAISRHHQLPQRGPAHWPPIQVPLLDVPHSIPGSSPAWALSVQRCSVCGPSPSSPCSTLTNFITLCRGFRPSPSAALAPLAAEPRVPTLPSSLGGERKPTRALSHALPRAPSNTCTPQDGSRKPLPLDSHTL